MSVLVVGAYAPELTGLPEGTLAAAVGIGAVDAAAGTAVALTRLAPSRVALIGTCGAIAGTSVGDLVIVDRALAVDRAPGVEVPEVVVRSADADPTLVARALAVGGWRRAVAECTSGVTVEAPGARDPGAVVVEHMECFAVYRACALAGVPVIAILAVANRVGAGAREEWRRNARAAETAAVAALRSILPAIGDRLPLPTR